MVFQHRFKRSSQVGSVKPQDSRETLTEHLLAPREKRDLFSALHGNTAIAVEFDLKVHFLSVGSAVTGLHCTLLSRPRALPQAGRWLPVPGPGDSELTAELFDSPRLITAQLPRYFRCSSATVRRNSGVTAPRGR
jgi:hypothetical protein